MEGNELFGEQSGLKPDLTEAELRASINAWIGEFKAHVLEDMDGLIRQTAGPQKAFWREKQERYAMEITELEKEIRTSN